ncbi:Cytochrome c oxidase assembly protein COX19 [Cyberlindnera fabianii]|uniref:Cytochrome c oxidase assembly protein COX19 n=1 Tax=Cyberlindnera fabianii TaxID=36022 RepID=A0A1V2L7Q0_CYBFA|nr:Cytochrome c oxidase assembly protein COX19 [Cyberlindnera fabianii]
MAEYLNCLKLVEGNNALNCRLLAKKYLGCRMDNQLMDRDEWKNLGLPDDQKEKALKTETISSTTTTTTTTTGADGKV